MFYVIERVGEAKRNDLLKDAQRVRQARVFVGHRHSIRRPIGRLLVRVGNRLNDAPQQEPRLAGAGESG